MWITIKILKIEQQFCDHLPSISYSYVMLGDTSCTAELRKLIAQCVSSDPQTYNNVFLGRNNSDYCNWILDKENWGGK